MATNLKIDPALLDEAVEVGGFKTKREAVTAALRDFIQRRRQLDTLGLMGTIDYDPEYDYKAARHQA